MESLAELYTQLREPIFRFLLYLTGQADVAEELTQETFLQALVSFARFRGEASVSTWLYSIARNVYRKRMWQEQRRRSRRPPTEAGSLPPDPQGEAVVREEKNQVGRALAALSESHRTVLVMREYEGLTFAEIAHLLGRTETWARVTCFRARQALRTTYLTENGGMRYEN